jgi:hypothetical protein
MNPNISFKEPECPKCHKALKQKTEGQKSTDDKTHESYGDRKEKDIDAACIFCEELFADSKSEVRLG